MNSYPAEIERFNAVVEPLTNLLYVVRDNELQQQALVELSAFAGEVAGWKRSAISQQNEKFANIFLGCECVVCALRAEFNMWLQLKSGKPDDAWNSLVDAQMATSDAMRADSGFSHLEARAVRLAEIEHVVFPQQVFLSAGLLVGRQECSTCGAEYGDCPHVVGKPYMGEFCRCILRDIEADHIAIVDQPANKKCRIVYFDAEGGKRNRMTWKVEGGAIDTNTGDGKGLATSGIILTLSDVG